MRSCLEGPSRPEIRINRLERFYGLSEGSFVIRRPGSDQGIQGISDGPRTLALSSETRALTEQEKRCAIQRYTTLFRHLA